MRIKELLEGIADDAQALMSVASGYVEVGNYESALQQLDMAKNSITAAMVVSSEQDTES